MKIVICTTLFLMSLLLTIVCKEHFSISIWGFNTGVWLMNLIDEVRDT